MLTLEASKSREFWQTCILLVCGVFIMFVLICALFCSIAHAEPPTNLWQGLIAEDASGDYQTYLVIASVVKNRLDKGMNNGLVALKRKNLEAFVDKESKYALTKGKDLKALSKKAINEVWQGNNHSMGATHYEHTGVYPIPYWAKKMTLVKVVYKGTKKELTLWRAK